MVGVFREVRRVLREDGTLWLNIGDSYNNAGSSKDGEGLDGRRRGGATGPDGACGYRKRDLRYALRDQGVKHKDLVGIPWLLAFALRADGWWLRQDIIWHKPNPMPESVRDRCTKAHEYLFLLSKRNRYYYDADAISEPLSSDPLTWGRHSKKDPGAQAVHPRPMFGPDRGERDGTDWGDGRRRNRRSVWSITTQPFPGAHFAVMPETLVEFCIKAGCPVGGIVLDPFVGSGTAVVVARRLLRCGIGFDLSKSYIKMAKRRIAADRERLRRLSGIRKPNVEAVRIDCAKQRKLKRKGEGEGRQGTWGCSQSSCG
jgi:DNA modification methylase